MRRVDGGVVTLRRMPRARSSLGILASLLPRRGARLGMVTAILPCGALVAAWGIAAAAAHPVTGAGAMVTFGAASAPGLLVALLGRRLGQKLLRRVPSGVLAAAWFGVAVLLLGRLYVSMEGGSCGCHG